MTRNLRQAALRLAMVLAALAGFTSAMADPIPVELFARKPEFTDLKLSPDGRFIAALVPNEKGSAVGIIRLADGKMVGSLHLETDTHIADFLWVKKDRIVASLAIQDGPLDTPQRTGELVAINADGSDYRYLFGYRGTSNNRLGTMNNHGTQSDDAAFVVDPLIDDPDNILISVRGYSRHSNAFEYLYRLNVHTGAKIQVDSAPIGGGTTFIIDPKGQARYALVSAGGLYDKVYQRLPGESDWKQYQTPGVGGNVVSQLRFSKDGNSVYLGSQEFGPHSCLVQHVLATGERRKLACDASADLDHTISGFSYKADPIAAVFEAGKPEVQLLETGSTDAQLLKMLMDAFPGKQVTPVSVTLDGKKALILVDDDRTPGDYYLFDTQTRKADFFTARQQWIDPDLMAERRPIQLKARDGTPLWGYLTLPRGVDPKRLPLVVNPHGGPFYERDQWAFDDEPQMLASRGYAVLQVNFRGSDGYGSAFIDAGRRAWGTTMIDDITDATRWTIAQGYADPARVCIYGASYGGYAALMSAVREPDLYRCAIGYAGIYDLKLLKRDGDTTDEPSGLSYFKEAIAGTDEEMVAQSPLTYIDRLKAKVMIIHGEGDRRAPFSQAKALRSALEDRKVPVEWLVRPGEGHGFWKVENIEAEYRGVLAFLDKNIGPASVPPAAQAAPATATPVANVQQ